MRIVVTSIFVEDQEEALRFYAGVLGFQKKHDIPLGEHRWLTVISPEEPDGVELLLEPSDHPAVRPFKQALVEDGIPCTSFGVEDVSAEYARLQKLGVRSTQPPTKFGEVYPSFPHPPFPGPSSFQRKLESSELGTRWIPAEAQWRGAEHRSA